MLGEFGDDSQRFAGAWTGMNYAVPIRSSTNKKIVTPLRLQLPTATQLADSRLCVAQAWLLLDTGRLDEVDRWLTATDVAADPADAVALRDVAVLRTVHRFKIGDPTTLRPAGYSS